MRKKIFFQFFSVTLIAVLLMFVSGIVAVNLNGKEIMKERLQEETELVCSMLDSTDDFSGFAKYEHDDAFRVTVLNVEGEVLYESDTRAPLENHAEREEIRNALNGTPKTVERYSDTFGFTMTYYALKTELADGTPIILRLAIKNSEINGYLGVSLPILFAVLVVALVVSLFISKLLSDKLAGKINEVGESLKSLNAGNYEPIRTNSGETELYSVLNEINELNESMHRRIRKISDEHGKLNTVLKNISQGIVAVDEHGKIVFANKSVLSVFDSAADVKGLDLVYLIDDVALCEKIGRHLCKNYQAEYLYKGKELSVVIRRTEKSEESGSVSSIVIITDVTKEKALQKQKNEFFANASHELKTPVTVMQGLSEILLNKEGLDDGSRKQIGRIHTESLRLSSLISDMLKLSRLENGEMTERALTDVDLKKVAEEVLSELSEEIEKKGISAEISGGGSVRADGIRIFEILQNLLSNAVHYNKEGGRIEVGIADGEKEVTLTVRDTGIGIEKENLPRLCERFYRVDKSRSKKTGGTGLGLAIVKHVCALYNAEFTIDSEIDVGTCAKVVFPKENS